MEYNNDTLVGFLDKFSSLSFKYVYLKFWLWNIRSTSQIDLYRQAYMEGRICYKR